MTIQQRPIAKRVSEALTARHEERQWESFIVSMLEKLELPKEKRKRAVECYEELARHVARKLGIGESDAHVVVQGSMRTQTTIAMRGNTNFDLDIVVKLSSARFTALRDSEKFFNDFGEALKGVKDAGEPKPKNRCWRLQYPGEPFYFDVTPAIPFSAGITGTDLRVRDPNTTWSPSNPEEFADWFCTIAKKRFPFQEQRLIRMTEAKTKVDPVPDGPVSIDDILRRTVQLIKLHRDNFYRDLPDARREGMPISVIIVTLATKAYDYLVEHEKHVHPNAIEVALEVVDRLPSYIDRSTEKIRVDNPAMDGTHYENFADRWNGDEGLREGEFRKWHKQLTADLEALFDEEYSKKTEQRIKNVFSQSGVDAWRASIAPSGIFGGLLGTLPAEPRSNPKAPVVHGSRNQLA